MSGRSRVMKTALMLTALAILTGCGAGGSSAPDEGGAAAEPAASEPSTDADATAEPERVDCRAFLEEYLEPVDPASVAWPDAAAGLGDVLPPTCVGTGGPTATSPELLKAIWLDLSSAEVDQLFDAGKAQAQAAGYAPVSEADAGPRTGDNGSVDWWGPVPADAKLIPAHITLVYAPDAFTVQYVPVLPM